VTVVSRWLVDWAFASSPQSGLAWSCFPLRRCTLAESPSDPLHRELRQLCCLRCRLDCYRVERTSSRAGVAPAVVQRLSRCTVSPAMLAEWFYTTMIDSPNGIFNSRNISGMCAVTRLHNDPSLNGSQETDSFQIRRSSCSRSLIESCGTRDLLPRGQPRGKTCEAISKS
jgi:hypothetical protein